MTIHQHNTQKLLPVIPKEIYQMAFAIIHDISCSLCPDLAYLQCAACEDWICEEHIGFQQIGYVLCEKCCMRVQG